MTLRQRIERLEDSATPPGVPIQIIVYGICAKTQEAALATIIGRDTLLREDGETEAAFKERVAAYTSDADLPPNCGVQSLHSSEVKGDI